MAACRALAARSYSPFVRLLLWDLCEQKVENWSEAEKTEKLVKAVQELPEKLVERLKCKLILMCGF